MLVKDCMTRHPILISPEAAATEAEKILAENRVRHLPVVGDGADVDEVGAGRVAAVQAIVDGSDSNTAAIVLGYARGVTLAYNRKVEARRRAPAPPAVLGTVSFEHALLPN